MKTHTRFISMLTLTFSLSLLLTVQTAHADFRKALEAYQNRDGDTLLKEVKDAVEKKNDEGLMLLLMATNMDAATSDYDETTKQSKSTLRAILSPPKWDEMRELLVQATNNSSVDAQYYLVENSPFRVDLAKKRILENKLVANAKDITTQHLNDMFSRNVTEFAKKGAVFAITRGHSNTRVLGGLDIAEAGDPFVQLQLGLQYLNETVNDTGNYGCPKGSKHPICQSKDETKGIYWLKQAANSYDVSGVDDFDVYASSMCEYEFKNANGDRRKLEQSYLWCLAGVNERGEGSNSMQVLNEIRDSRKLTQDELNIFAQWDATSVPKIKQLPTWLNEVRAKSAKVDLPVFTYYFVYGVPYFIELYLDGRVLISFIDMHNIHKDLLVTIKPKKVNKFLAELDKTGIKEWMPKDNFNYCYGDGQYASMQVNIRNGADRQRVYLWSCTPNLKVDEKKIVNLRISKIYSLVEKYFPTSQLRCGMGNSLSKKQACLVKNNQWVNLTSEGK